MALKQLPKRKTHNNLGSGSDANVEFKKAALFKIAPDGTILKNDAGVFLLNPSTYDDAKSVNWAQQTVPGQSDPILQFISGGARTVTFDALITADTAYFDSGVTTKPGTETDPFKKGLTAISDIASSFFKIAVPPAKQEVNPGPKAGSLDITNYLNYYRSLLYPKYDNARVPNKLRNSPPLLVLWAGSAIAKIKYETRISSNHDLWVLTDLKIKVTKQLPTLAPMEAVVSFTLIQYNVRSFDGRRFSP